MFLPLHRILCFLIVLLGSRLNLFMKPLFSLSKVLARKIELLASAYLQWKSQELEIRSRLQVMKVPASSLEGKELVDSIEMLPMETIVVEFLVMKSLLKNWVVAIDIFITRS